MNSMQCCLPLLRTMRSYSLPRLFPFPVRQIFRLLCIALAIFWVSSGHVRDRLSPSMRGAGIC